jgi:hypothetical protein
MTGLVKNLEFLTVEEENTRGPKKKKPMTLKEPRVECR